MKRKLIHLPLEPYKARYTEMLGRWERTAFSANFEVDVVDPLPNGVPLDIMSGEVLDNIQRPSYALNQVSYLLANSARLVGLTRPVVWFSDFYTSGIDSLLYSGVLKNSVKACFLWAQTFDVHDFTFKRHWPWMRHFEAMAFEFYDKIFVADPLLAEFITASFGPDAARKVHVCPSLPFSVEDVQSTYLKGLGGAGSPPDRDIDVVFSSRLDEEKCPEFYADLIETNPKLNFAICCGHPDIKGTATKAIVRLKALASAGKVTIYAGLSKSEYYRVLARSKIQFNCAKQDWVSFTLLEALAMGCTPVYPMTRSFTNVFPDGTLLYKEGSIQSASTLIDWVLNNTYQGYLLNAVDNVRRHIVGKAEATLPEISKILFTL